MIGQNRREIQPIFPEGIDYYDPTNTACDSAATGYLMWLIGAPCELWTPGAIDVVSGRVPGKPTEVSMVLKNLLALLENGAVMHEITPFDPAKFLSQGLSYVEEHHKDDWLQEDPDDFYSYWEETLDEFTETTADFEERIHTDLRHSYSRKIRRPNKEDLHRLVTNGHAVKALEASGVAVSLSHAVVVHSLGEYDSGQHVTIFNPNLAHYAGITGPCVGVDLEYFCRRWQPDEGIIGIKTRLAR